MPTTFIIGHTKPDTDAVVAPMALAYLYRELPGDQYPNPIAAISEELNPETTAIFAKFGVEAPRIISADDVNADDRVILVDHNEESQRLPGLNQENIYEILDHHKANLNLPSPIAMTFLPWGSSSTIVYHLMKLHGVNPEKTLAALMLAAILSDTVGYKSATTTEMDREAGNALAEIAEITDVEAYTLEIFKAKSDVSKLTEEQIVKNDYKVFDFAKKTMINQVETVEQDYFLSDTKKADLLKAMEAVKAELGVDLIFTAITDVLQVNTKLLILSDAEREVAEKAFGGTTANQVLDIGPLMSRKKEIAPPIEKALA